MKTCTTRRAATVTTYAGASGYHYAQAFDAATGEQITDAAGYTREGALRELGGKWNMLGVAIARVDAVEGRIYGARS